jgi:hypothetical protein
MSGGRCVQLRWIGEWARDLRCGVGVNIVTSYYDFMHIFHAASDYAGRLYTYD